MDLECVHFLQWALPKMDMQWSGFRKVRKQVCKRIKKRMSELTVPDWKAYKHYLLENPNEWKYLDGLCRVTISRFYRDYYLFDYLGDEVIPKILHQLPETNEFKCLSIGCASGEEPYSLSIMWHEMFKNLNPHRKFQVIGLDVDTLLLDRASKGLYKASSIRELPKSWISNAFIKIDDHFRLKDEYKSSVKFREGDIRSFKLEGAYSLVCCRNLVATYFSEKLQLKIFHKIKQSMSKGAALLLGTHESLPGGIKGFSQDEKIRQLYWVYS